MPSTSPGYSITLRVEVADSPATALVTTALAAAGGRLTALDVVESHSNSLVVDVTGDAIDAEHAEAITAAVAQVPGVTVRNVSDRTFLIHLGGKLSVTPTVSLKNRDDLSRAYTPGVARVCMAIAANPADARKLTIKRNTVAIVTDGSAVLGLGNIGPAAAMPVMEGKAALFKRFADVDAWPVCLDTQDVEEIIRTVQIIAPTYGGINLEDISAPRCFEVERRLRELLDIPVFHDDQHGTAIVVLAALTNALHVVGKKLSEVRIVVSGVGAAGNAIINLLHAQGASDIVGCDRNGVVESDGGNEFHQWIAENTNPRRRTGTLREVLAGADVFIGVSRHPTCSTAPTSPPWPPVRSCSHWRTPIPRSTRSPPASTPPSWQPAGPTTPTRSTTCSPSPASSAACSTPAHTSSPTNACSPPRTPSPNPWHPTNSTPNYIWCPAIFDPQVATAVARGGPRCRARPEPAR